MAWKFNPITGKIDQIVDPATASDGGSVELATDAETLTGTAIDKATTPANITTKLASPGEIGGTSADVVNATEFIETDDPASETGGIFRTIDTPDLSGNTYSIAASDYTVLIDDDDADVTDTVVVTLPAAASNTQRVLNIKKIGSSQTVQVDGNASETIDGNTTYNLTSQYDCLTLHCDGTGWVII